MSARVPQGVAQRITGYKTGSIWKRYDIILQANLAVADVRIAEHFKNGEKTGRPADSKAPEPSVKQALPL